MKSLFDLSELIQEKEIAQDVVAELTKSSCSDCRLSLLHPDNKGLVWRGNLEAKIAVVGEAPGDKETQSGVPFVGNAGKEFERWCRLLGLDTKKDVVITNVLQCQPKKEVGADGRNVQAAPEKDEIKACLEPRCLRFLRSLPNLEVAWTLGWVAAKALLGGDPGVKSHGGQWFSTTKLPGVAVYCMFHPAYLLHQPSQEKKGRAEDDLKTFKREYLDTRKIIEIYKENESRYGNA